MLRVLYIYIYMFISSFYDFSMWSTLEKEIYNWRRKIKRDKNVSNKQIIVMFLSLIFVWKSRITQQHIEIYLFFAFRLYSQVNASNSYVFLYVIQTKKLEKENAHYQCNYYNLDRLMKQQSFFQFINDQMFVVVCLLLEEILQGFVCFSTISRIVYLQLFEYTSCRYDSTISNTRFLSLNIKGIYLAFCAISFNF